MNNKPDGSEYETDENGVSWRVYTYQGKDYKIKVSDVHIIAQLYNMPDHIRHNVMFWAKLLNNPD